MKIQVTGYVDQEDLPERMLDDSRSTGLTRRGEIYLVDNLSISDLSSVTLELQKDGS